MKAKLKLKLKKPRKRRTKLERTAAAFGQALGEQLGRTTTAIDETIAAFELHAALAADMTDEQRDQALAHVADVRAVLEALPLPTDDRFERQCSLDRIEGKLRRLHPIAGSLRALERVAEYVLANPLTPADADDLTRQFDEFEASDAYRQLAAADPEAHAASVVRIARIRAAIAQQEGN